MATQRLKKGVTKKCTAKRKIPKKKKTLTQTEVKPKKPVIKKPVTKEIKEKIAGIVTHYFPRVKAAAIKLKMPLSLGETVRIKGHTTDFTQEVTSLQIDCQPIKKAKKGQEIGLLVNSRVRRKDIVYKL